AGAGTGNRGGIDLRKKTEGAVWGDVNNGCAGALEATWSSAGRSIVKVADQDVVLVQMADASLDTDDAVGIDVAVGGHGGRHGGDVLKLLQDRAIVVRKSGQRGKCQKDRTEQNLHQVSFLHSQFSFEDLVPGGSPEQSSHSGSQQSMASCDSIEESQEARIVR